MTSLRRSCIIPRNISSLGSKILRAAAGQSVSQSVSPSASMLLSNSHPVLVMDLSIGGRFAPDLVRELSMTA